MGKKGKGRAWERTDRPNDGFRKTKQAAHKARVALQHTDLSRLVQWDNKRADVVRWVSAQLAIMAGIVNTCTQTFCVATGRRCHPV